MNINMTIDSELLIDAAAKMPVDEKLKLYERIKDDIIKYRVEEILASFKTDDISEEEITEIVEHVRSERYKNRR
ncbi:MAG TPA: hypothetical protein PKN50_16435 [Spirochaetota bacterium]|nr:hypothetical protein [Spirochaetota bacterium]HPV43589.1 hypothetical protein [Spirochaetota bacterium]